MRDEDHPTREQMEAFLRARLDAEGSRRVVRHLLAECAVCRASIAGLCREEPQDLVDLYDPVFTRAQETLRRREVELAHERIIAPGLVAGLEERPRSRQLETIEEDSRYHSWGLCERLMQESRDRIFAGSPKQAVDYAQLAVAVAESLDPERFTPQLLEDLCARAWGELGNAMRTDADFAGSSRAFEEARARLARGTGDPYEEARLISLEASLELDLGQWEKAASTLDRPLALYRSQDNRDLLARTLVQKAGPVGYLEPQAALPLLREAEELIDRTENPRMFLCARHNRIYFLNDAGDSEGALLLLQESRSLYRQFPDEWSRLRVRWLEARIAQGLGHLDEAEAAMSLLWSQVFERRLRLELALLTLDLTAVYLEQGEMKKAWRTAGRLVPLFQAWGVHRHAVAAWLMLQRAFAAETATAGLIRQLERYLRRCWKNPEVEFQPAGD
jgi:hypothetical protein